MVFCGRTTVKNVNGSFSVNTDRIGQTKTIGRMKDFLKLKYKQPRTLQKSCQWKKLTQLSRRLDGGVVLVCDYIHSWKNSPVTESN